MTGELRWLAGFRRGKCFIGLQAGTLSAADGYRRLKIDGRRMLVHRVIWKLVYGEDPAADIDHINGQRDDNRLVNLRLANRRQNQQNRSGKKGGLPKGVYQHRNGRFVAQIKAVDFPQYLGTFDTAKEAHDAYAVAALQNFGDYACLIERSK